MRTLTRHLPWLALLVIQAVTSDDSSLPLRQIYQFSYPTYLQDVAVGTNGDLLMTTVFPDASIYRISGATRQKSNASLVHRFDDITAATSIAERVPDVYNFLGGKQTDLGVGVPGSFGVWELDMRSGDTVVRQLVGIPDGGLLAGILPWPGHTCIVLVSDATLGKIYRVDICVRSYEVVLEHESMYPPKWAPLAFGVGGLHLRRGYLYYANSFNAKIYRVRVDGEGYPAERATVEMVHDLDALYLDNFAIGPKSSGVIWACTNADNRVVAIERGGETRVVAGAADELTVAGAVSASFGRLPGDQDTLYVVTSGAMLFPINGSISEGGKVVALDTGAFVAGEGEGKDEFRSELRRI